MLLIVVLEDGTLIGPFFHTEYAEKVRRIYGDSASVRELVKPQRILIEEQPYIPAVYPMYNSVYGDGRRCRCEHFYYSHFTEDWSDGCTVLRDECKHCDCKYFVEE